GGVVQAEVVVGGRRIAGAAVVVLVEGALAEEGRARALRGERPVGRVAREAIVVAAVAGAGRARNAQAHVGDEGHAGAAVRAVVGRVLADEAAHRVTDTGGLRIGAGDRRLHALRRRIEAGRWWRRRRGDVGQRDLVRQRGPRGNRIADVRQVG